MLKIAMIDANAAAVVFSRFGKVKLVKRIGCSVKRIGCSRFSCRETFVSDQLLPQQ